MCSVDRLALQISGKQSMGCIVMHVMCHAPGSPEVPCPGVPAAGADVEAALRLVPGGATQLTPHEVPGHEAALQAGHGAGHKVPGVHRKHQGL